MSALRLYMDEDAMDKALRIALRSRGIDLLTAAEAGMVDRDDEDHLAFATGAGRILYSHNASDYLRIHSSWLAIGRDHCGIALARQQRYSVGDEMRMLVDFVLRTDVKSMQGQVVFLKYAP